MQNRLRLTSALGLLIALGACSEPLDLDLRGKIGGSVDTSEAARNAVERRPRPDDRGIISYPNYQVAVAQRGDTLASLADRIGLPAAELARFNGMRVDDSLRRGEVVVLPRRVSEPSPATGAAGTGPIQPPEVDVTELASAAIDRAEPTPASSAPAPQTGLEPLRHRVERGETAFTIARRYDVSPRSLAEWNGLDSDFAIREGQLLLIPAAQARPASDPGTSVPGSGSPTPEPPSAAEPLPDEDVAPLAPPAVDTVAAAPPPPAPPVADIGAQSPPPAAAMVKPVEGPIIRAYAKGRNEGIDIGAPAGTPVKAAASGSVASVTTGDGNVMIVVIRHPDDLLTIYTHLDTLTIKKGDAVSKGQTIGKVRPGSPSYLHFEVRKSFESQDPVPYIQ